MQREIDVDRAAVRRACWSLVQHTFVEPQLKIGYEITPFEPPPPSRLPTIAAGSAVIVASADDVTRIWAAFAARFIGGKPPGIGVMPQPLHPPPPLHQQREDDRDDD